MRWLIDEMLPHEAAELLHNLNHDAVSVVKAGLGATDDGEVYAAAVSQGRVIVTEDAGGFIPLAKEDLDSLRPSVAIVLVRKDRLGRGGAMARNLADALHHWAQENPDPYHGPHWL